MDQLITIPNLSTNGLFLATPLPTDQDPAIAYLNGNMQSTKGRYTQGRVILQIASWLNSDPRLVNWSAFQYTHIAAICNHATQIYKPATARKYRAALFGIAMNAFALGHMNAEQYQRARLVPPIKGESVRKERYMSQGEINALMDMCAADTSPAGPRDGAILSLLYVDVIRRSGIVSMNMQHYQEIEKDGRKVGKLIVMGKGNIEYTAYIMDGAKAVMDDWLSLRGTTPGPLFMRISQTGVIDQFGERMTDQSVYNIVKKRCKEAGVENVSPHTFRHTGIGRMLEKGKDLASVARVSNHKDPKTTAKYDPRADDTKIDASAALHINWKSRTQKGE